MNILITAHPRSGTGYSSQLCTALGCDMPHERIGINGTVSWKHIVLAKFDKILLQTRNPLLVISSSTAISNKTDSWNIFSKYLGVNVKKQFPNIIERCMFTYVYWNRLILRHRISYIYKIEEISDNIGRFCNQLNCQVPKYIPHISNNYNTRKHIDLKLSDLFDVNINLAKEVIKISSEFGYNLY